MLVIPVPHGATKRVTCLKRGDERIDIVPALLPGGRYRAEPTSSGWILHPDSYDGEPIVVRAVGQ